MAKVFISYSHDSDHHKQQVQNLAVQLRTYNLEVVIDQDMRPGGPDEGWDHWSESQIRHADNVLIACTERYCACYEGRETMGLGSIAEARLIHRILYNAAGINRKFRVILFRESDALHVPFTLLAYHRFLVDRQSGLNDLVTWLTLGSPIPAGAPAASPPALIWPQLPAAGHIWDMANRRHITSRLEQMLTGRSQKPILLLSAPSNSGKTHLLAELKAFAKTLHLAASSLDCNCELPLEDLVELISYDLRPLLPAANPSAAASARQTALIGNLQNLTQPVLLSFDTYEQASPAAKNWIENHLLSRLDDSPGILIVIAGKQVPDRAKQIWAGLADELRLEPITQPSDWLEYARRKWQRFNVMPEHIEALTLATRGNPGQLSALLETMIGGLTEPRA